MPPPPWPEARELIARRLHLAAPGEEPAPAEEEPAPAAERVATPKESSYRPREVVATPKGKLVPAEEAVSAPDFRA
jgi:hypothetical protein